MNVALRSNGFWLGPDWREAQASFEAALRLGLTPVRALVVGHIASFKDCWTFARTLADAVRCCRRTVQRAVAEAKSLGLMGTGRAKKNEIPKGRKEPLSCGWSHRWIIARGMPLEQRAPEQAMAKTKWWLSVQKRKVKPRELFALRERKRTGRQPPPGVSTAEWLDRMLEETAPKQPQGP